MFKTAFFVLSLSAIPAHIHAKNTHSEAKIVAIVNKDSITNTDIESRIRLIMMTSGLKDQAIRANQLRAQVLNALIDESLQIQAAKDKKIVVSEKELNSALESMAADNKMTLPQMVAMLKAQKINKDTLALRLKAQMTWVRYIRALYGFLAAVSDAEVDTALKKLHENQAHEQYALSEIVLLVPSVAQEGRVRGEAQKIVEQIRQGGASFGEMARQFSQDPSSVSGGALGWVVAEQVDPAVHTAVKKMSSGQISDPIRTSSGFKIILLREKKKPGEGDPGETKVSVCQVAFDITPETSESVMAVVGPQVDEILQCKGCDHLKSTAKKYQLKVDTSPSLYLNQLPDQMRQMIQSAPISKPLQPIMTPEGLRVFMVCSKKTTPWVPPSRDEVMGMLEQAKLSTLASRDMMKLRANASLDIRDPALASLVTKG